MFPSQLPKPRHHAASAIPTLRWGIIGPGWIAERFVKSLKELSRQQVVAVSSRTQQKPTPLPPAGDPAGLRSGG